MSWIKPAFGEDGSTGASAAKTSKISNISNTETENTLQDKNFASIWLDKLKPKRTNELVVDKAKINELEQWLQNSMNFDSTSKILLLTGPPGCGKITTFRAVCNDLRFRIIEWTTPLDRLMSDFESPSNFEYHISVEHRFKEHIFRATRYNSCLVPNITRRIVLVKDFPFIFMQRPTVLHDILETLSGRFMFPVVFICNKNPYCNEMFPLLIRERFGIHTISFNPVTEKRVYKMLKTIVSYSSKSPVEEEPIPNDVLYRISRSCQGDLRNAILGLYLMSVDTPTQFKKKDLSLEPVRLATKDENLDFFNGLGRVLYPKRIESGEGLKFVHSADKIVENFESEPGGFLSQLHENYPSRMGNMEDLSKAAERLATSDLLRSRWQDRDIFNHYCLAVAVRGLMGTNRTQQKARFEAFRKSQTATMEVDIKEIELEGKTLFSDLEFTNYDYLVDVLPFAKILMSNLKQNQLQYVQKTCSFN